MYSLIASPKQVLLAVCLGLEPHQFNQYKGFLVVVLSAGLRRLGLVNSLCRKVFFMDRIDTQIARNQVIDSL